MFKVKVYRVRLAVGKGFQRANRLDRLYRVQMCYGVKLGRYELLIVRKLSVSTTPLMAYRFCVNYEAHSVKAIPALLKT